MPSKSELERLAAAAHAMRPEWPARSVLTYLERDHATKAYRDLAVALAHVAADPTTVTPKRLSEPGPWWRLTTDTTEDHRAARCPEPGHTSYLADNCGACRSEQLALDDRQSTTQDALTRQGVPRDRVRAILQAATTPTTPDVKTRAAGERP
jgi:hypothetical protein